MRTEIQYGIRYLGSGTVVDFPNEVQAYLLFDSLVRLQVPAEVVCRRVTYGMWRGPTRKLLPGSYVRVGERG